MITGTTSVIVHVGFPTHTFASPRIYNPYFDEHGIDAVVVPMACRAEQFDAFLPSVLALDNVLGALVTMPHKMSVVGLLDEVSIAVRVSGTCNAVRRMPDGRLFGDMFDGEGFVRGLRRAGFDPAGTSVLLAGCGGVGSAIAASLAGAGVTRIRLVDTRTDVALELAARLAAHHPGTDVDMGTNDPRGFGLVVNATPLGMSAGDPVVFDAERLDAAMFVADVVLGDDETPLVWAARAAGALVMVGRDMLYEQIPAYLEFFGLPTTTPDVLRRHG